MLSKTYRSLLYGKRSKHARWRDSKGNFVGWSRMIRNGTRAAATGVMRLAFDRRPALPWISYDAIAAIDKHLGPDSRILEFGSGMSTVWFAARAREVFSVDDYEPWFRKVQEIFSKRSISNVRYSLASLRDDYVSYGKRFNQLFDLIVVDGSFRADCIQNSLELLADGGAIYFDNSDFDPEGLGNEFRPAEALLIKYAEENNCSITYFTDFAPTQFFVSQGMFVVRR